MNHQPLLNLRAPAKINWFLSVLARRKDGYHDIDSLMQCVSLYDDLLFHSASALQVICDSDIPLEDNLVYKAASLLQNYTSCRKGIKIILHKNIPTSAGLGGGSSDAASTLLGLNTLWGLGLKKRELAAMGLEIGSDVPFFLNGPSALIQGRGERITHIDFDSSMALLLVKPPVSVSTAWAYKSVKKLTKKTIDIKLFCRAFDERDFASLSSILKNDLEKIVVKEYPVVGKIKNGLLEQGSVLSAMSGSGPTVFGVFESTAKASSAAREFGEHWCRVVTTVTKEKLSAKS
ncbi:MAG: 4-(cytidine 5'-diphospho)-2-C-methyl-D-erythritol kinase [Nitrospirae bacterium RBG_13_43_8]|nr:MAG: 4-(cytidine 5'-diphospho)-2-C-methyl-D-erythritol kinase [Nitrospirae bacterium RBG_13_43_8]